MRCICMGVMYLYSICMRVMYLYERDSICMRVIVIQFKIVGYKDIIFEEMRMQIKSLMVKLSNRSLIIMRGEDTLKLVQSLITNDIHQLSGASNLASIYTWFLSPKGKVVSDGIIIRPTIFTSHNNIISTSFKQHELFIDVPRNAKVPLMQHLSKYTWRKKVTIQQLDTDGSQGINHYATYTSFLMKKDSDKLQGTLSLINTKGDVGAYAETIVYDPRDASLGGRIIVGNPLQIEPHQQGNLKDYEKNTTLRGICKWEDMANKLPFQFNMDLLNGVNFQKGCYLGQEIISRSYFSGIIRRRVFPYILNNTTQLSTDQKIVTQNGLEIGKIISAYQGYGIALINYVDFIKAKWPIKFTSPQQGYILSPYHQSLCQYYQKIMKNKKTLQILDL